MENIKRQNFKNPQREDKYGTSVISIQFSKYDSSLSIKNRYNHSVQNPDNTFNSNLDNIISGLTDAFYSDFGVKDTQNSNNSFTLENYVKVGGKYYYYNLEMNNIYYCDNNILIDYFRVKQLPNSQMLVDTYIIDFQNKTISLYDDELEDSMPETISNIKKISYSNNIITIEKEDNTKVEIEVNDKRQIISYTDESLTTCKDKFLMHSNGLIQLNLPALQNCGDFFAFHCESLQKLNLPSLQNCDDYFLSCNKELKILSLPVLKKCGFMFISENECLQELNLPALQECGPRFLEYNTELKQLYLPALQNCGTNFMYYNTDLQELNLPALKMCYDDFLYYNTELKQLNLPALQICGNDFVFTNKSLKELNLPVLQKCGDGFLHSNTELKQLNLPALKTCGKNFMFDNTALQKVNLPSLCDRGTYFLHKYKKQKKEDNLSR